MKKAIAGFRYNTETAELIDRYSSPDQGKPDSIQISLYQTTKAKKGFLHGKGGMLTIFKGKEDIIPVSGSQAISIIDYIEI